MPFDGIVTKCITYELDDLLKNGRVDKIHQPEKDEIFMHIRAKGQNLKLLLSASSNYARAHLTNITKKNPLSAPLFCMILRKHLVGAKISGVEFNDFERIITFSFENTNELGELAIRKLIIEIMGRHSNIILINNENRIIDSIKHVDFDTSSVREIMPARTYTFPPPQNKKTPVSINFENDFIITTENSNISVSKYILNSIKGFSPLLCDEICYLANINDQKKLSELSENELSSLKTQLSQILNLINNSIFKPCIIYDDNNEVPLDYHCLNIFKHKNIQEDNQLSYLLDKFYSLKDHLVRIKQKKSVVQKKVTVNISRCTKKIVLHEETLRKAAKRDKFKLFGELITANIYKIPNNIDKVTLQNYYSDNLEEIEIKLESNKTPQFNAQKYFKKYTKSKTASIEADIQLKKAKKELDYLETIQHSLDITNSVEEIEEIRDELIQQKYLPAVKNKKKKTIAPSKPMKFVSTDGFTILVGKNNIQNDQLTMKLSKSFDLWLHTKDIHGSHVVIKLEQHKELPKKTIEEAAIICAYYSKARNSSSVPVDFTNIKNVKKPSGSKPGMVIYVNYQTIIVNPDEKLIFKLKVN